MLLPIRQNVNEEELNCLTVVGFVEELLCENDPEYEWSDHFRSPRKSNDARSLTLTKLSLSIDSMLSNKAKNLGANLLIGVNKSIDVEGDSGLVCRVIATACKYDKSGKKFKIRRKARKEVTLLTINQLPKGAVIQGLVCARSVKYLGRLTAKREDLEARDEWWQELREEVKSHVRNLNSSVCIGYKETCEVFEDVCVYSGFGTAISMSSKLTKLVPIPFSIESRFNFTLFEANENGKVKLKLPCEQFHTKQNNRFTDMNLDLCGLCKKKPVPNLILSTTELPPNFPICGQSEIIIATVIKTRPKSRARTEGRENDAVKVSDILVFAEIELHKKFVMSLKLKGFNCAFGIKTELTLTATLLILKIYGSGILSPILPAKVANKFFTSNEERLIKLESVGLANMAKSSELCRKFQEKLKIEVALVEQQRVKNKNNINIEVDRRASAEQMKQEAPFVRVASVEQFGSNIQVPTGVQQDLKANISDRDTVKNRWNMVKPKNLTKKALWAPWKKQQLKDNERQESNDNFARERSYSSSSSSSSSSGSSSSSSSSSSEGEEEDVEKDKVQVNEDLESKNFVVELDDDFDLNEIKGLYPKVSPPGVVLSTLKNVTCSPFTGSKVDIGNIEQKYLIFSIKINVEDEYLSYDNVLGLLCRKLVPYIPCEVTDLQFSTLHLTGLTFEVTTRCKINMTRKGSVEEKEVTTLNKQKNYFYIENNLAIEFDRLSKLRKKNSVELSVENVGSSLAFVNGCDIGLGSSTFTFCLINEKLRQTIVNTEVNDKETILEDIFNVVEKQVQSRVDASINSCLSDLVVDVCSVVATPHEMYYMLFVTGQIVQKLENKIE